jgi:hypothetical protein
VLTGSALQFSFIFVEVIGEALDLVNQALFLGKLFKEFVFQRVIEFIAEKIIP